MISGPSELDVPAHWHRLEFLSDLHLQDSLPRTRQAFADWLAYTQADAIFLLGDLFEVWLGDDVLDLPASHPHLNRTAKEVGQLLRDTTRHRRVYLLVGNRDFLLGPHFFQATGVQPLNDPCLLRWRSQRLLISHGDAWCLADHAYQQFRTQVRSPAWQHSFLSKPLAERHGIAQTIRQHSQGLKLMPRDGQETDVDDGHVQRVSRRFHACTVIHGHTHRPGTHPWSDGRQRWVLSDWDLDGHDGSPLPRGDVLRLEMEPNTQAGQPASLRIDRVPVVSPAAC